MGPRAFEPAAIAPRKAASIVLHAYGKKRSGAFADHGNLRGARMLRDICERLLDDAVNRDLLGIAQHFNIGNFGERHLEVRPRRKVGKAIAQRWKQAELVE